jgi:3-(3-hydroxy-phenyl)propionate hydroxylase
MTPSEPCDVALIGLGPTGATLASLLGRAGHRVRVIERDAEVYQLPRAVHFDHEVMRIFQSIGASEAILPHTRLISDYRFLNADRELLLGGEIGGPRSDQGWAVDYMFHQPSLERVLRDMAEEQPTVEVAYGCELAGLEQDADGATVRVRGPEGEASLRARFVVGCDGAGSATRRAVGLELEDLGFDEPWVVVDLRGAKGLPDHCIQLCDPARPTTLVPGAHDFYRFEFMLRPGEGEEMNRPEKIRELLEPWLDPDSVELVRAAVYRFHAVVAREWRRGRVAIAGDAAHQTPPFLGQGMCAGIRDAANLAWKLDLVLRGRADAALLDTYGSERSPHVRAFIQTAIDLGRIICTQDPEVARVRDAELLAREDRGNIVPILPDPGPGCLQGGRAQGVHPRVGRLAPQPRVRQGDGEARLDDVTGQGFRLVLRDARGWPDDARCARFDALGGRVVVWGDAPTEAGPGGLACVDAAGEAGAFFDRHGLHAFLVRPDHVTFGVAKGPEDVAALLDDLEAALATAPA